MTWLEGNVLCVYHLCDSVPRRVSDCTVIGKMSIKYSAAPASVVYLLFDLATRTRSVPHLSHVDRRHCDHPAEDRGGVSPGSGGRPRPPRAARSAVGIGLEMVSN